VVGLIRRVRYKFSKQQFLRDTALVAIGTAMGQGLIALSSPLLTRIYTPESMGILTTYHAIISLLSVVNSLRYEVAIPMAEDDEEAANILILCFWIVIFISLAAGLVAWLLSDQIALWLQSPEIKTYFWLIPFGSFVSGTYQVLRFWGIRKKLFSQIAQSQLAQGLSMVVSQVSLGLANFGIFGLLAGYASGYLFSGVMLANATWASNSSAIRNISIAEMSEVSQRYRRFPLFSAPATFVNRVTATIPYLLLLPLFGTQVTGWFGLGYRTILTPTYIIGLSVSQVYLNAAANMAREKPEELKRFFQRMVLRLFLVSIIPTLLLLLFGSVLFNWIFGENWREAGVYVQILAPVIMVQFVFTPLLQTTSVIERQDLQLTWDISALIISLLLFGVAWWMKLDARTTIALYSISTILSYLWLFWLYQRGLNRFVKNLLLKN
jgi:O-antigen/teichoic acid export membrane protein